MTWFSLRDPVLSRQRIRSFYGLENEGLACDPQTAVVLQPKHENPALTVLLTVICNTKSTPDGH